MREASILDPVHPGLAPQIWSDPDADEPVLKPHVADFIKHTVYHALEANGYRSPKQWLKLVLTGSLTTYQYSDESDCDVSLFVDSAAFPEWSRAEMIGLMISQVDGTVIPGSPFPLQDFVVSRKLKPADLYRPGLRSGYLIDEHRWIVPPERSRIHNVEQQENAAYMEGLQAADKMDRLLRYEPDKAVQYWHQIHKRRMRDQTKGKGDFSDSNIIYKFLSARGLFPKLEEATGEHIAAWGDNGMWSEVQPIRPSELSSPTAIERGHSRPVSPEEWYDAENQGKLAYEDTAAQADGTEGMDQAWPQLKQRAWQNVQEPWGGDTINAATGQPIEGSPDAYALTVKPHGVDSVSIPIGSPQHHFNAAMDEARQRFGNVLQRQNHHLGVFRDEDVNRIDFDPVLVVNNLRDAENIGAHTRNIGGAYHFKSGDGFWPPHVPDEHLAAGTAWDPVKPFPSFAQFRSANRTELAPVWYPQEPWSQSA